MRQLGLFKLQGIAECEYIKTASAGLEWKASLLASVLGMVLFGETCEFLLYVFSTGAWATGLVIPLCM